MARSSAWEAARDATSAANASLHVHKARCPRCATPRQQMCATGRALLSHLWDCQRAQHEAWHAKPLSSEPTLFGEEESDDAAQA
jgi:hypothetical protein